MRAVQGPHYEPTRARLSSVLTCGLYADLATGTYRCHAPGDGRFAQTSESPLEGVAVVREDLRRMLGLEHPHDGGEQHPQRRGGEDHPATATTIERAVGTHRCGEPFALSRRHVAHGSKIEDDRVGPGARLKLRVVVVQKSIELFVSRRTRNSHHHYRPFRRIEKYRLHGSQFYLPLVALRNTFHKLPALLEHLVFRHTC